MGQAPASLLLESGAMRGRHPLRAVGWWLAAAVLALLLLPGVALAQEIEITPSPTSTFSPALSPGTRWVFWMALGAGVLALVIVLATLAGYLRFAPKFGGREEKVPPLPPGSRPDSLARQAAQIRYVAPAAGAASATAPAAAGRPAATAVAERPAPAPAPEPAAEAPPVEAPPVEAPPVEAPPAQQIPPPEPEPAPAPEPEPPTEAEPAAAPAQPAAAPAQPAASHGSEMDQETFDRVLQEQLDKGVDRRVAEGRARAAAVVAARKKAQG